MNQYYNELKQLSDKSLTDVPTDDEFKRMMLLKDKLNIKGGEVPYPNWRVNFNMFIYKLFKR